ncbi:MAG: hypothetical protein ACK5QW_04005 [Cyanobacteriota bacterium]|jgi:hypothetical protein
MAAPSPRELSELALDLAVEERKLDVLVDSLEALGGVEGDQLRIDAAALRLQSLYAYDLQPEPVERLRTLAIALWPKVRGELNAFQRWLTRDN